MTHPLRERLDALTQKDNNGLLPCPFCGFYSAQCMPVKFRSKKYTICCNNVGCMLCDLVEIFPSREKAIISWNTRATESALITLCEDALRELEEAREYVKLEQNRYQMAIRLMRERHELEHRALRAQIEYLTRLHVDTENLAPKPITIAT